MSACYSPATLSSPLFVTQTQKRNNKQNYQVLRFFCHFSDQIPFLLTVWWKRWFYSILSLYIFIFLNFDFVLVFWGSSFYLSLCCSSLSWCRQWKQAAYIGPDIGLLSKVSLKENSFSLYSLYWVESRYVWSKTSSALSVRM